MDVTRFMVEFHRLIYVFFSFFKSLFSHRLSYFLKVKGQSFVSDSACSSSGNALNAAFRSIRSGQCENAIVAACTLTLHPAVTIQFFRYSHLYPLIIFYSNKVFLVWEFYVVTGFPKYSMRTQTVTLEVRLVHVFCSRSLKMQNAFTHKLLIRR